MQLCSVLPRASMEAAGLPQAFIDILEKNNWFPNQFNIDLNGETVDHKAVAELPFINQSNLHSLALQVEPSLTEEEVKRNTFGNDLIFFRRDIEDAKLLEHTAKITAIPNAIEVDKGLLQLAVNKEHFFRSANKECCGLLYKVSPKHIHYVLPLLDETINSIFTAEEYKKDWNSVEDNAVITMAFFHPPFKITKFGSNGEKDRPGEHMTIRLKKTKPNNQTKQVRNNGNNRKRAGNSSSAAIQEANGATKPKKQKKK